MAERRMFAKTIIDSDAFLDMPLSTQALYFHLSMRADDEGFINNPKKIQRMVGSSEDDLKLLTAKRFILAFDSGVIVIKHWKLHNYIRSDRFKPTMYLEEKSQLITKENKAYSVGMTVGIPEADHLDTQVRLGKDRLGKVSKDILSSSDEQDEPSKKSRKKIYEESSPYYQLATLLLHEINKNGEIKPPNLQTWSDDMRKIVELDKKELKLVEQIIVWSQASDFWSKNILSAAKLRKQFDMLVRQSGISKPQVSQEEKDYGWE